MGNSVHRAMECWVEWEKGWPEMAALSMDQTYHQTGHKNPWRGVGSASLKLQIMREREREKKMERNEDHCSLELS